MVSRVQYGVTMAVEVVVVWRILNAAAPTIARWLKDRNPSW